MKHIRSTLPLLTALLLASCAQQSAPTPAPSTLKPQDVVTTNVNDVVSNGEISKEPGQTGRPSFYLTVEHNDGQNGCNATGNQKATLTMTSSNPAAIPNPTGTYTIAGCGDSTAVTIPYTVAQDATPDQTVTLTVTASGGRGGTYTAGTLKVRIVKPKPSDTTPPVVTPTITGTLGDNGWYTSDVTVSWSAIDDESGVTSPECESTTISEDTASTVVTCTATSAGGETTQSVTIKRDATAPNVTLVADGTQGQNDWYTSDVTFNPAGTDATSGLDTCTTPDPLTSDTASHTATATCTDHAGNQGSATLTVKRDTVAPTAVLNASGTQGQNGWYTSNVTFNTQGSTDATSGLTTCTTPAALTSDTASHTATTTCTDNAGHTSTTSLEVKRDATAPVLTLPGNITTNATSNSQASVNYTYNADAAISGLASSSCTPESGSTFNLGTTTVNCTATDNAGNTSNGHFTITVKYDVGGFYQPINMDKVNVTKAGSAIPVKFTLGGYQGMNILAAGYPKSSVYPCGTQATDPVEETVTAGNSVLQWDAVTGQYVYVWKTDKLWAGQCRTLALTFADGTTKTAQFNFSR